MEFHISEIFKCNEYWRYDPVSQHWYCGPAIVLQMCSFFPPDHLLYWQNTSLGWQKYRSKGWCEVNCYLTALWQIVTWTKTTELYYMITYNQFLTANSISVTHSTKKVFFKAIKSWESECIHKSESINIYHESESIYNIKMKVKVTITIMPPLCTFVFSCQRPVSLTENQQWDALGNSSYPENQRKIQKSAMRIPLWDAFGVMAHILSKGENFCIFRFCNLKWIFSIHIFHSSPYSES